VPRFKLTIEYDGTRYSGWQKQPAIRTVQGELETAIRQALETPKFEFQGSGRTDAGVHALAQVAHLDARTSPAPDTLRIRINDALPADIAVLSVERASPTFHARHDAVGRTYLYQISRRRTAFGKRFVWWVKDPLDVVRMREATVPFVGMRDLQSFTDDDPDEKSTKVLINDLKVSEAGGLILIRIDGSHFLWKSVRRIVGILAEVGRGALTPAAVPLMLESRSDTVARYTAPPSGLFLARVYYRGDATLKTIHPLLTIAHDR
jgi:tRNA pseudouridine38-40 synthase